MKPASGVELVLREVLLGNRGLMIHPKVEFNIQAIRVMGDHVLDVLSGARSRLYLLLYVRLHHLKFGQAVRTPTL